MAAKAWRVDGAGMGEAGVRFYWHQKAHAEAYARNTDGTSKKVERCIVVGSTHRIQGRPR